MVEIVASRATGRTTSSCIERMTDLEGVLAEESAMVLERVKVVLGESMDRSP